MTVYLDEENERVEGIFQPIVQDSNSIHIDHIEHVRNVEIPRIVVPETTLNPEKITNLVVPAEQTPAVGSNELQDYIAEIEAQKELILDPTTPLPQIPEVAGMKDQDARAFLSLYAELVGELLQILARFGDRDRIKSDHMKKQYDILNKEVGGAIGNRGSAEFWSNLIAFGTRLAGAVIGGIPGSIVGGILNNETISKSVDLLGQQIPNFTKLWTTKYEMTQSMSSNRLSMITSEMQNISQKSGDTSGLKSEFIQFIGKIEQYYSSAARKA